MNTYIYPCTYKALKFRIKLILILIRRSDCYFQSCQTRKHALMNYIFSLIFTIIIYVIAYAALFQKPRQPDPGTFWGGH